jgi:hypothetical protein
MLHTGQRWLLYADDDLIGKAVLLSDAFREAMRG